MKKFKFITALALSLTLIFSASIAAFAATFISYSGYTLEMLGNDFGLEKYDGEGPDIVIPEKILGKTIIEINPDCFIDRTDIVNVSLPDTVLKIKGFAFANTVNLENINFPASLKTVSAGAFQNTGIKEADLSNTSLEIIYMQAFYDCKNLETVILPETLTFIGESVFRSCPSLTSVYIPESVTTIGNYAFTDSPNVTIKGKEGSYAQQYATENNIPFEAVKDIQIGDVDLSGEIDISDVTLIQKNVAEIESLTPEQEAIADVNSDGSINVDDATNLQKYIAELTSALG